jgi:hypothetical protein
METYYKLFSRSYTIYNLKRKSVCFEPEITAKFPEYQNCIYEVGTSHYGRTYEEGEKMGWMVFSILLYFKIRSFKAK